jgi:alpha-L-fucosidase
LYYSGGLDWTFEPTPILDAIDLLASAPYSTDYAAYVDAHFRELVERYQPDVLWNDISYPTGADPLELFAEYYNRVPEGVVNDRFSQLDIGAPGSRKRRILTWLIACLLPLLLRQKSSPAGAHADFTTPEYATLDKPARRKWEATRGLGYSFGYNQNETEEHLVSAESLVHLLADVVSKGGNLLLNVGPAADGSISSLQRRRLETLGGWLAVNGEAIYATRPVEKPAGQTAEGIPLRFTASSNGATLYAILLGSPHGEIHLETLNRRVEQVRLLGSPGALVWRQEGDRLAVTFPEATAGSPAYALAIS